MCIRLLFLTSLLLITTQNGYAEPDYEIMKSCQQRKPLNSSITMENIADASVSGFSDMPSNGCEYQYEINLNGTVYGAVTCKEIQYFIVQGKKLRMDSAIDVLKKPGMKPGFLIELIWCYK